MTKLPILSGRDFIKIMRKAGWEFDHQRGSHMILRHSSPPYRRLSVPDHKELAKGTLRSLLRNAGFEVEELIKLMN